MDSLSCPLFPWPVGLVQSVTTSTMADWVMRSLRVRGSSSWVCFLRLQGPDWERIILASLEGKGYSVDQSINSSDTCSLQKQMDLHLPLSMHTLLTNSNSFTLTYAFTLSFHLQSSLLLLFVPSILLRYTFFTNSSFLILSIWPPHLRVLLVLSSTPQPIPLPQSLIHTLISSFHVLVLGSSSQQHALSTSAPHSMSNSLTYVLELVRRYYSLGSSSRP